MKYKLEDIYVGDEVTWRSSNPLQSDYDECWEVHGKTDTELLISLTYHGRYYHWTLRPEEVITVIPTSPLRKIQISSDTK